MTEADISEKTDVELVHELQNGVDIAYDVLISRYASKLFQVSYGLLGNKEDSEEVVQDAFVRAYKAIGQFRGDSSFETWISRIVINLSRNKYKWNKRRGSDVNISMTGKPPSMDNADDMQELSIPDDKLEPNKMLESIELENRIMTGIKQMPEKLRETMILRHVEDLSYEAIAELLKCKIGTVKSRLARGREVLKSILSENS